MNEKAGMPEECATRRRVLAMMFLVGVASSLAQITLMRELLVAVFGNELTLAVVLAAWLMGIALGALAVRRLAGQQDRVRNGRAWLIALLFLLAAVLPAEVVAVRGFRHLLEVPSGEYASLGAVLILSVLASVPSAFCIGAVFPLAVRGLAGAGPGHAAIASIYAWESFGSLTGGAVLTFVLLPLLTGFQVMTVGVLAGLCAVLCVAPRSWLRTATAAAALGIAGLLIAWPSCMATLEKRAVELRWRACQPGRPGNEGAPEIRLLDSRDSVYQNLALTESQGKYALYANGRVMFAFPDPTTYECFVHFVMGQKPGAGRVLLLGGDPMGDIPELLKYPLTRLVHVELDPAVGRMIGCAMPGQYAAVMADPRLTAVRDDAPRFVRHCADRFDAIIVRAPEPSTVAANRFYTREFYEDLRRLLRPGGFVCASVRSSERLQSAAGDMAATVHRTLESVFPVVLVTAGSQNVFLAGDAGSGLTFDRQALATRWRHAGIRTAYFRPEYFLMFDDIDPDKTRDVVRRFHGARVAVNTNLRPVTYFYNLMLWSSFSGSHIGRLLDLLTKVGAGAAAFGLLLCGACCAAFVALAVRMRRGSRRRTRDRGTRLLTIAILTSTGFCGMSLQVLLIYVFQSLYGYVYGKMGLIVAVFMLGLMLGAPAGRRWAERGRGSTIRGLFWTEGLLLCLAIGGPIVAGCGWGGGVAALIEVGIYGMMAACGWSVGVEFQLANRLYAGEGASAGDSASVTGAADHVGAMVGCLLTGVILIPVMGFLMTGILLGCIKAMGLLGLWVVVAVTPTRRVWRHGT